MYSPTPGTMLWFSKSAKNRGGQTPSKKPATAGPVFGHHPPALDVHYAKPTLPKPPKMSGQACVDNWEFWGGREGVGMCEREGGRGGRTREANSASFFSSSSQGSIRMLETRPRSPGPCHARHDIDKRCAIANPRARIAGLAWRLASRKQHTNGRPPFYDWFSFGKKQS